MYIYWTVIVSILFIQILQCLTLYTLHKYLWCNVTLSIHLLCITPVTLSIHILCITAVLLNISCTLYVFLQCCNTFFVNLFYMTSPIHTRRRILFNPSPFFIHHIFYLKDMDNFTLSLRQICISPLTSMTLANLMNLV